MAKKKFTVLALHVSGKWTKYRNVTNIKSLCRYLMIRGFDHANIYESETKKFVEQIKLI